MAARKSFLYFGGADSMSPVPSDTQSEFDEAEVWNSSHEVVSSDHQLAKKSMHSSGLLKSRLKKSSNNINIGVNQRPTIAARSLPVTIPDWPKILGDEYRNRMRGSEDGVDDDDEEEEDECGRLPPHEYLAKTRGSSFSVQEGIGRTLKGRDLSRMRNAVWKQIGFED